MQIFPTNLPPQIIEEMTSASDEDSMLGVALDGVEKLIEGVECAALISFASVQDIRRGRAMLSGARTRAPQG